MGSFLVSIDITISTAFARMAHRHFSMSLIENLWAMESDYRHFSRSTDKFRDHTEQKQPHCIV